MLGLGLTPEGEEMNREQPTGYRRWLVSIALSSTSVLIAVLSVVYGYGADTRQIQQNKEDIRLIQIDIKQIATKDDIKDIKETLNRLDERLQRMQERELNNRK
jgi:hypothetical protein